ncbi:energy transducer TonB [Chitinilyticum aquatile]|uniref:energy transducer TonB n=1 Tax=Chitinilyticum aquatile TaxID=362520 RepID=UPI00042802A7|nr:energy transducer TonB [Chitinilyticum aquatile]
MTCRKPAGILLTALGISLLLHLLLVFFASWEARIAALPVLAERLQVRLDAPAGTALPSPATRSALATPRMQGKTAAQQAARPIPGKVAATPLPVLVPAQASAKPAQAATAQDDGAGTAGSARQSAAGVQAAASGTPAARFVPASSNAAYLNNPPPEHPAASRRPGREEEGRVVLRVKVLASGEVESVSIEQSSGFYRLDRAARDAVLRWRFVPARRGDEAVADTVLVPITFQLHN